MLTEKEELRAEVELVVNAAPVMDVHTHLFPPEFNELCLGGIDDPTEHLDQVFDIAGGSGVVMTNDHLDEAEGQIWKTGGNVDTRFKSSLRLDSLLNNWEEPKRALSRQGVVVTSDLQEGSVTAIRMQIADALCGSYEQLLQNGRAVTREEIARDVRRMFEGNFNEWLGAV